MIRKLFLFTAAIMILFGCAQSTEDYILETSIAFAENLHSYSFSNEKWSNEAYQRIEKMSKDNKINEDTLLSYDLNEIYPEYIQEMQEAYCSVTTENGFEQVKQYLIQSSMHFEKEVIEFDRMTEYENTYTASVYLSSPFSRLHISINYLKTESKPLISGFNVTVLEFKQPQ